MIQRTPSERRKHHAAADFLEERAHALAVACRYCRQPAAANCRNPITGDEFRGPAHPGRIADADRADREETRHAG